MSGRHDALFKVAFSQPANAAALACCSLSPPMQAFFDWSTMRLHPGSFVKEALADRHTDLLFEVQSALGKMLLYILFEHQSWNYIRMPLRLGRYMDRIWDGFDREHPSGPLPPILPLVITHSSTICAELATTT
jgi:predicted transposase YdaD